MAVRSVLLTICLSLLVLMSFGTGDAFAWGNEGHRIVCPGYDRALSAELRGSSEAVLSVPLRLTFLSLHCSPVLSSSQRVTGRAFRTLGRHAVERRRVHTPSAAPVGPRRRTNAAAHHTLGRQASQEVSTRTRSGL